jgi:hypothetical protein
VQIKEGRWAKALAHPGDGRQHKHGGDEVLRVRRQVLRPKGQRVERREPRQRGHERGGAADDERAAAEAVGVANDRERAAWFFFRIVFLL